MFPKERELSDYYNTRQSPQQNSTKEDQVGKRQQSERGTGRIQEDCKLFVM